MWVGIVPSVGVIHSQVRVGHIISVFADFGKERDYTLQTPPLAACVSKREATEENEL